jgi:hypothetical protein
MAHLKRDSVPNAAAPAEDTERSVDEERVIRCKRCEATIARTTDAIAVEGKHLHRFVNPAGVQFDVRCFGEAAGASPYGDSSTFFSWFPGHAWRIAVCAHCGVHLGWRFESALSSFHGLITDRIVEAT